MERIFNLSSLIRLALKKWIFGILAFVVLTAVFLYALNSQSETTKTGSVVVYFKYIDAMNPITEGEAQSLATDYQIVYALVNNGDLKRSLKIYATEIGAIKRAADFNTIVKFKFESNKHIVEVTASEENAVKLIQKYTELVLARLNEISMGRDTSVRILLGETAEQPFVEDDNDFKIFTPVLYAAVLSAVLYGLFILIYYYFNPKLNGVDEFKENFKPVVIDEVLNDDYGRAVLKIDCALQAAGKNGKILSILGIGAAGAKKIAERFNKTFNSLYITADDFVKANNNEAKNAGGARSATGSLSGTQGSTGAGGAAPYGGLNFGGGLLKERLNEYRNNYDYVIIGLDGLAVDSLALARASDAVVLDFDLREAKISALKNALSDFLAVEANVVGVVIEKSATCGRNGGGL
jgi:hypothetical protein